jgi:hypothetical protein
MHSCIIRPASRHVRRQISDDAISLSCNTRLVSYLSTRILEWNYHLHFHISLGNSLPNATKRILGVLSVSCQILTAFWDSQ